MSGHIVQNVIKIKEIQTSLKFMTDLVFFTLNSPGIIIQSHSVHFSIRLSHDFLVFWRVFPTLGVKP